VPRFPIGAPSELALRVDDLGVLPFPTFMGTMNSMDMQHLEVVHGVPNEVDLETIEIHESGIRYDMVWHDPNFGRVEQHIEDFGVNVVTVTRGLIADDEQVLRGVHFRVDKLVPADRALTKFFRYVEHFPRAHPGADRIR
jgi:hypothetical protein